MNLSLRRQLWLLCGGFLLVLATVATIQLPAVRNMTLADMMHDGLRSVVLASLLAAENNDAKELEEVQKEAEEKSADFRNYLAKLESLNLNEATKSALTSTKPEMNL